MRVTLFLAALALVAPAIAAGQPGQAPGPAALADRIETLRREWRIPGAAVAIVRNDSVLLSRGFGVQRIGEGEPVDAETLFAIGSTTKAFTSAAIALLVGEGALDWDDPVTSHLPAFALSDPWLTREITIRDLLAHRSGLPMANLMWLTGLHDTGEMVRRLRFLEPSGEFRGDLSYQNVLYAAAGMIVERVAGVSWDEFVATRLLGPLGMDRSRTGVAGLVRVSNVASPHAEIDGRPRPVPYRDADAVGAAGSILSSADDLAAWLRFQLADGRVAGRALVSEATLLETRRPQIPIRPEGALTAFYPDTRSLAYGMGWVLSGYRGRTLLDHGGGIDGMTSLVALVPEERLGIAILTNLQTATPPYWILYPLLDALLGEAPVDRSGSFRALADEVEQVTGAAPARRAGRPPALPLTDYPASYGHPALGEAEVEVADGRLVLRMGRLAGPLVSWHFETFRVDWDDRAWLAAAGPGWVTFRLDRAGNVEALDLVAVPGESWRLERAGPDDRPPPDGR